MSDSRAPQLAYSTLQSKMSDESQRRLKADKMAAVAQHFLGRDDLSGLRLLDVGCSVGIVSDRLHDRGATVVGVDIDVPGVETAQQRFGGGSSFLLGDSERLPFAADTFDVVVCNHVYEHVVDPARLVAELRRVVRPDGILYLGLGNKLGVMEPHYRLPFLSYLPQQLADRYVRVTGRAEHYHEEFKTRRGLLELFDGLHIWDYTFSLLAEPGRFAAGDVVPGAVGRLPAPVLGMLRPIVPTFVWVGTPSSATPLGPALRIPPAPVASRDRGRT